MDGVVTLIGGGGFIGRYAARELLAAGARVRIAARNPKSAWFIKTQGALGQTQFVAADLTRPGTIATAVKGAEVVVNLVGTMGGGMDAIHVDGARTAAKAAAEAGASAFIQISAIGADASSASAYARTKGLGEQAVREAFPRATILRPSVVFGPEDAFLNRFARMARLPVLPVLKAGARFQPVFVADVARAIAAAVEDPARFGGRTFELGGPEVMTMRQINDFVARETGHRPTIVDLPDAIGSLMAGIPGTPITRDQWVLLGRDNVVGADADGLAALGIRPTPVEAVAPSWLVRYRRHGRFSNPTAAA